MMLGEGPAEANGLGDLEALQGVKRFPFRVKCATPSWHTLENGLKEFGSRHPDSHPFPGQRKTPSPQPVRAFGLLDAIPLLPQ